MSLPRPPRNAAYLDPRRTTAERVHDLVPRMTWTERIAQLCGWYTYDASVRAGLPTAGPDQFRAWFPHGVAAIGPLQYPLEIDVALRARIQQFLREDTRLGIPALFLDEACHGLMKQDATSFPTPIGLACAWNEELTERIFRAAAKEMHARGGHQALTPILDVGRDPRWGRIEETMGEDPLLIARLGAAMVRGLQGGGRGTAAPGFVLATLKHFAGHGNPEGGLNRSPGPIGPRELRDVHLPPFQHVLRTAHPAAVMPSYNEVDGLPSHANRALLRDVLRGEFGFTGLIVSDYEGIERLLLKQKIGATPAEAARRALDAGVEVELPLPWGFPALPEPASPDDPLALLVNAAVTRLLTAKFDLGLFEAPAPTIASAHAAVRVQDHAELALQAARESIVLLQNRGGLLPLDPARVQRIAVIGPNADVARLGAYSGTPLHSVSLLEGLRSIAAATCEITHAPGCRITRNDQRNSTRNWFDHGDVELVSDADNASLIADAVTTAAAADVIILALGDNEQTCRETWGYGQDHLGDRASLLLPGSQMTLARAVIATGKPVVLYLMNGRPPELTELAASVPAILEGWYAGQATGTAAAEILFGRVAPSGKLCVSLPRDVGHIPAHYSRKHGAGDHRYLFSQNDALFPFGHGLSYSTFTYGAPRLSAAAIPPDGVLEIQIDVANSGPLPADEIVQLYVTDEAASVTRPVKELKDFARVTLHPGETRTVHFTLRAEQLAFTGIDMKSVVEPGYHTLQIGGSSVTGERATFEVLPLHHSNPAERTTNPGTPRLGHPPS